MKKLFWDTQFLEGARAKQYLKLLNYVLQPSVDEIPLAVRRHLYFQQDRAPRNFAGKVRSWLDEILFGRFSGRREQIKWPPNPQNSRP